MESFRLGPAKLAQLFVLFFAICLGLGYPSLNRVDSRTAGGLGDVTCYAGMVVGEVADCASHMQFRVLTPSMAHPVYSLAKGRIGTWNPVMLGLLVANSVFVAGTATLLVMTIALVVGDSAIALGAGLLYLLNFAIPNLRLAGFVDAGQDFFLMAATWCLLQRRWWLLSIVAAFGALAKESSVPLLMAFSGVWWLCERKSIERPTYAALWIAGAWAIALMTLSLVQWHVGHLAQSPLSFGLGLRGNDPLMAHFFRSLTDRNLWYIFVWLLPLGLLRARRFPVAWRSAAAAASVTAFAMDAYYGGAPGTIGRTLFSAIGPLLTGGIAVLVFPGNGSATNHAS
ncbi:MAG TPA: hypothetical protein VN682_15360 [Terriglobales bacterium]|nr:hypothetical protein [Terriglobales bacterium]